MLKLSLKAIDRLRNKYDIDVYIADDDKHPISNIPDNIFYQQTTFNRRGNLNGIDALSGVLNVYKDIFNKKDYDWIFKIDPDTIINDLDDFAVVDPLKFANDECGNYSVQGNENMSFLGVPLFGCLHGISKFGLDTALVNFTEFDFSNTLRIQEDLQRIISLRK